VSVSPELMQRMTGGGQPPPAAPGGAPGSQPAAAGQAPQAQAPAAAPMSTPQDKRGVKAAAMTNLHIAVNMLEEAIGAFGSESKEGGAILKALNGLAPLLAKKDTSDLVPAEILQMVKQLPQMGGGTQVQQAIMKQMQQAKPQPAPAA